MKGIWASGGLSSGVNSILRKSVSGHRPRTSSHCCSPVQLRYSEHPCSFAEVSLGSYRSLASRSHVPAPPNRQRASRSQARRAPERTAAATQVLGALVRTLEQVARRLWAGHRARPVLPREARRKGALPGLQESLAQAALRCPRASRRAAIAAELPKQRAPGSSLSSRPIACRAARSRRIPCSTPSGPIRTW